MASIGQLLRARREAFGVSIEEAARWCPTSSADRLARIESSEDVSSTEFEQVCQGLAIAPTDLLAGEDQSPRRSVARFRSALSQPDELTAQDVRTIAAAAEVGRTLASLLAMQGKVPSFDVYRSVRGFPDYTQPWEQGYELGEEARQRIGPAPGPIGHFERFLNSLRIHVARVALSTPNIEGASVWEGGAVPVILLNTKAGRVKYSLSRRAILAHELCHLLHDGGEADIATRATCAEGVGNYEDTVEQRARAFAPAFLAPRDQVQTWATTAQLSKRSDLRVVEVAAYWGLSFEGAVWHAKNARLLSPDVAEKLAVKSASLELPHDQFDADDIGFPPDMINPELPSAASPLMDGWGATVVVDALEASVISLGRARELLLWK